MITEDIDPTREPTAAIYKISIISNSILNIYPLLYSQISIAFIKESSYSIR